MASQISFNFKHFAKYLGMTQCDKIKLLLHVLGNNLLNLLCDYGNFNEILPSNISMRKDRENSLLEKIVI